MAGTRPFHPNQLRARHVLYGPSHSLVGVCWSGIVVSLYRPSYIMCCFVSPRIFVYIFVHACIFHIRTLKHVQTCLFNVARGDMRSIPLV